MAGPEDSTSSSHHGNGGADTHQHLLLQGDDIVMDQDSSDQLLDRLKSKEMTTFLQTTEAETLQPNENFKIEFRQATDMEGTCLVQTAMEDNLSTQLHDKQTSQQVCRNWDDNCDVFNVGRSHLFDLEEDTNDKDYDDVDMAVDNNDLDGDVQGVYRSENTFLNQSTKDSVAEDLSLDISSRFTKTQGANKGSRPRPIRRCNTSPIITMCRESHSQLVLRCQAVTASHPRMASSCPAFFSPKWTEVMLSGSREVRGSEYELEMERKRRNTIGSRTDTQHQLQRTSRVQDDPRFVGRMRSYSESDLQRLLMKQMSKELRRMGDVLNRTRGKLTTVNELANEEDVMDDVFTGQY